METNSNKHSQFFSTKKWCAAWLSVIDSIICLSTLTMFSPDLFNITVFGKQHHKVYTGKPSLYIMAIYTLGLIDSLVTILTFAQVATDLEIKYCLWDAKRRIKKKNKEV